MKTTSSHTPVMLSEVLSYLKPTEGKRILDCTFGLGGYSKAFLEKGATVVSLDRDPAAEAPALKITQDFRGHFQFYLACFDEAGALLANHEKFDGIVLDLGVSSPQLDQAERGFSFRFEGPLDMRMSQAGLSVAEVVNTYDDTELEKIIKEYGEERRARSVARAIVDARKEKAFETTSELAALVRRMVPKSADGLDPATRTFQALRIYVNDELGQLERFLEASLKLLKPGGCLVVVSFHSLEDRIAKLFMAQHGKREATNKYSKEPQKGGALLEILTRKPILPSKQELRENPRSRSAKLRAVEYKGEER
jgi:16S rRNA (cytosine1402-N4)-methyltransferase